MNVSKSHLSGTENLANLFQLIGQPIRIQILLAIGESEVCVCHLEAVTGMRQAVISQHLMLLRKAGLVTPNRAGRNIYYRLTNPGLMPLMKEASLAMGIPEAELSRYSSDRVSNCPCPKCAATRGLGERSKH